MLHSTDCHRHRNPCTEMIVATKDAKVGGSSRGASARASALMDQPLTLSSLVVTKVNVTFGKVTSPSKVPWYRNQDEHLPSSWTAWDTSCPNHPLYRSSAFSLDNLRRTRARSLRTRVSSCPDILNTRLKSENGGRRQHETQFFCLFYSTDLC